MEGVGSVMIAVIPVFLVVITGFFLRRTQVVKGEVDRGLTTLLVNVFLPCLVLINILGSKAASDIGTVSIMVLLGFMLITVSLAICYYVSPVLGFKLGEGRRSFALACGIQNYGYMAIPLLGAVFNNQEALATLFLHNLGVEVALWTVSIMLIQGSFKLTKDVFLKGPVIAVFLGVTINLLDLATSMPEAVVTTLSWFGQCAIPVGLLLIGFTIADVIGRIKFSLRLSGGAVLLRLVILPAMFLAVASLFSYSITIQQVLIVQAAMPGALFPIVLAKHYGGQPEVVAEAAITTNALSFLTMPFTVALGAWWLGV